MMTIRRFIWSALPLVLASVSLAEEPPRKITVEREKRNVLGWTVMVDKRLLSKDGESLGKTALGLLEGQLRIVALTVPEDKVKRLRQVPINLDRSHGELVSPQYHPSPEWLRDHGYAPTLAKAVHIPDATYFTRPRFQYHQPSAVLHELSHAYHDQVLNFNNPEIKAAWQSAVDAGRLKSVRHIDGRDQKHYALTNPQEFFAEMTESYLGHNDFFPFNAGELRTAEPEIFTLLERIWGKLP